MSELVVLVPVLNRPESVAPLVASFAASGAPGRLLFVTDHDDYAERAAIADAGAQELDTRGLVTWPKKINAGYRATTEPWMLLAADDVRFRTGWWDATEPQRRAGFGVIGTNDLGNLRVMRGDHATHALVSREYADTRGTIDGPGAIVCEDYGHWYCDDELVETAKARGAWAPCLAAHVEHRHPYWGRGQWDATYQLGQERARADRAVWQERAPRIAAGA